MITEQYDVIVAGAGGMGSAALYHLARGIRACAVERFGIAHDQGSSHGDTRIIRKAYMEHPDYVPLLHRAYALWEELEAEEAGELFARVGLLVAGDPDAEAMQGQAVIRRTTCRTNNSIQQPLARVTPAWPCPRNGVAFTIP